DWNQATSMPYLTTNNKGWDIKDNAFRKGCYTISADVTIDFFGKIMQDNDFLYVNEDGTAISGWPTEYGVSNKAEDGSCMDFLFFKTLPSEIDNRITGGGEEDEEIDIEPNDIEGDFQANWAKSMQDAKVLTYAPMDNKSVHIQPWMPYRKGVTSYNYTIYSEDVVSQFYGNTVKNLWLMLPPNAAQISIYIKDPEENDPEKAVLWSCNYDFRETVNHILASPNGLKEHWIGSDGEENVAGKGSFYGYDLNLDVKDPSDPYYKCNEVVNIPCDYTITNDHPNLQIGYTIVYPGEYKENYKNGRDEKGGLKDGYWYSCSYLLPTSRTSHAFMSGDDDPDWHNGRVEDFTSYTSSLMSQDQWATYASLFCFVETEGNGGFPHTDIRFDAVKSSRCYVGDSKVPFNTTFTNYGVDAIKSATFDVTLGDDTLKIRFKDGIRFLEQVKINDDIKAPVDPSRQRLQIKVSKINGKDVDIASGINGSIVAVNESEDVDRMPVIEENTGGTWNGWTPRSLVGMEMLREKYGEDIALIGIHTGSDLKAVGFMDDVLATFGATGAPSCVVNRLYTCDPYGGSSNCYFGIKDDVDAMRRQITEATIGFDKVERSKDGQHITLTTSTLFNINCDNCPYTLTYVIVEDDLQYSTQMNYFTDPDQVSEADKAKYKQNAPELYELTQKPSDWRPVYNNVMVYCAEGLGLEGSLTGAIVKGEPKQHSFIIDIPKYTTGKSFVNDINNCRLIALLIDKESQEIINAAQMLLADAPISFYDGEVYSATTASTYDLMAYTRTFNNTNWQALYVPFSIDYEEWCDGYDVARVYNFIDYDDNDDGEFDRTYLVVKKLTSGSTSPNYPYLIRAKETGTHSLVLQNKTLEPAQNNSMDCSSADYTYTFTGTYATVTDMYANGYYALNGGSLQQPASASVTLKPQRWYMAVTSRTGGSSVKAQTIRILVDGEETTGIETSTPLKGGSPAYDLTGRAVSTATNVRGITISNGKKVIR
ncbi:MAG: hypothetical protein KBS75_07510, partial [Bacteroidales bacterium]|nr:hypothetical protein [Candidatus Equimonas faecalis]